MPTAAHSACDAVRACRPGLEYETAAPTPTSDRVCTPLTTCHALQYEQRGAHGDNFCHRDDHEEAVSPFNLFEYVAHMKGRSGVMGTKRRAPD